MNEIDNIQQVQRWKTSDGEEFTSYESAKYHAETMDKAFLGNEVLAAGGSMLDALIACGYDRVNIDPIFERLTKNSAMVIEHWQCRDSAGYKLRCILPNMRVRVSGDAGSWSGSYGNEMSLHDLAIYAKHPNSILSNVCPSCEGCGVGHNTTSYGGRVRCGSCNGSGKVQIERGD